MSAHVLKRIFQFDLLGDGNTVVGDQRGKVLFIQNHVSALGAHGDFYGIGELIHASLNCFACFFAINNLFCHLSYLHILCNAIIQ